MFQYRYSINIVGMENGGLRLFECAKGQIVYLHKGEHAAKGVKLSFKQINGDFPEYAWYFDGPRFLSAHLYLRQELDGFSVSFKGAYDKNDLSVLDRRLNDISAFVFLNRKSVLLILYAQRNIELVRLRLGF